MLKCLVEARKLLTRDHVTGIKMLRKKNWLGHFLVITSSERTIIIFIGNFRANLREKIKMSRMSPEVEDKEGARIRHRPLPKRAGADRGSWLSPQVLYGPF